MIAIIYNELSKIKGGFMKSIKYFFVILILAFSTTVMGHSGGTDSNGCHTNHKTGDYHCHR